MADTSQTAVQVGNLSDTQLQVQIVGANGDKTLVLLQPRSQTSLPPGYSPVNPKQKFLYVYPSAVEVTVDASKAATKQETSK